MGEERDAILLVYVGGRIGGGDKVVHLWLEVSQREADEGLIPTTVETADEYRSYTGKASLRHMGGTPGAIYRVEQSRGTTAIYAAGAKYVGLWPDDAQRLTWQGEHRMATATAELRKRKKKEGAADAFAPLLPLRELYRRTLSQDRRAALIAQIIAYVTR